MASCPKCGNRMSKVSGQPQTCRRHGAMGPRKVYPTLVLPVVYPKSGVAIIDDLSGTVGQWLKEQGL